MALLVNDTYTDTDAVTLTAHTPDLDTIGTGWAKISVNPTVASNQMKVSTSFDGGLIDVGQADCKTLSDFNSANAANRGQVMCRSDGNVSTHTYYYGNFSPDSNSVVIGKAVSGTFTSLVSASPTLDGTIAHTFELEADGTSLVQRHDGADLQSTTDSSITTGNYAGWRQNARADDAARWDNLQVDDLVVAAALDVKDSKHLHKADFNPLLQNHFIAVEDSKHLHKTGSNPLLQNHFVTVEDNKHLHKVDSNAIEQLQKLTVESSKHLHRSDINVIDQLHKLTVEDNKHLHKTDTNAIQQNHLLTVEDNKHLQKSDTNAIGVFITLSVNSSKHIHRADNNAIQQNHLLTVEDNKHLQKIDANTIIQNHFITIEDSQHKHTSDNASLELPGILRVQDSKHLHKSDFNAIEQLHKVTVEDSQHNHTSENVEIGIGAITLSVNSSKHLHRSDAVSLLQNHFIVVEESKHVQTVESNYLSQLHKLTVEDNKHIHTSDIITWTPPIPFIPSVRRTWKFELSNREYKIKYNKHEFKAGGN